MVKLDVHDEESEKFTPMELDTDTDLEKSDQVKKSKESTSKRTFAIAGVIILGIFIASVIIPQSKEHSIDVEPSAVKKTVKAGAPKEQVPKYEPKSWCLNAQPGNEDAESRCQNRCSNPLAPKVQLHFMVDWYGAHALNKEAALNAPNNTDVVFLGDDLIEGWTGLQLGKEIEELEGVKDEFKQRFDKEEGAEYHAIALGATGDKTNHLLWRLQNGELPDNLNPKVFWLQIGSNNFEKVVLCSDQVVTRGVIKVVEELQSKRPESKIVINAILPTSEQISEGRLFLKAQVKQGLKTKYDGILMVNKALKKYSEKHENVYFVDFTSYFVDEDSALGDNKYSGFIPKEVMYDWRHLTLYGYQVWGDAITETLIEILHKDEEN